MSPEDLEEPEPNGKWAVAVFAEYSPGSRHWALVNHRDGAYGCNSHGKWAKWYTSRETAEKLAVLVSLSPAVSQAKVVTREEWEGLKKA